MSVERAQGSSHEPFDNVPYELGEGENSGEVFGVLSPYPYYRSGEDPNDLIDKPEHARLRGLIETVHGAGQEAFGQISGNRGLVITVLSSAAVAAGAVGIGILIRRRNENKDEKSA